MAAAVCAALGLQGGAAGRSRMRTSPPAPANARLRQEAEPMSG